MWVDYKQNITIPLADAQTGDMFLGTARMELTCLGVETTHFLKHRCVSVCASVMKMFSECLWYHLIEVGKYKFWSIQHAVDPQRLCKPGASVMKMFSECLWYHLIEVGKYKFWSIQHAVDPQRLCKPGALKVFFF